MLDELTASNLGLITASTMAVDPGLTVISGETGTGKTVMLGALRLLRGEKASKSVIGPASDACEVSARFYNGEDGFILRRRVDPNRSRAYLNDAAVTSATLAETLDDVVAIVGQHDQHRITSSGGVRDLIDQMLPASGRTAKSRYSEVWATYRDALAEEADLDVDARGLERERDMLSYQIAEIDEASLSVEEEGELAARVQVLRHASSLRDDLDTLLGLLSDDETGDRLTHALRIAEGAASVDGSLQGAVDQLTAAVEGVSGVAGDIALRVAEGLDDPAELQAVEVRLSVIKALERKYGDTIEDVITFGKDAASRLEHIDDLLERAGTIDERLAAAEKVVSDAGRDLAERRMKVAAKLSDGALGHLRELGFSDPTVAVLVEHSKPSATGADTTTVLFASDTGLTAAPVAKIASGGELSRLVLALTLSAGTADASVIAFDEIDAGVGGNTALAMGRKLAELARDRQVLCVTHLPQVAAFAGAHYTVERTGSEASLHRVEGEDRLVELTRMLSGLPDSEKGRDHAEELLALAQR